MLKLLYTLGLSVCLAPHLLADLTVITATTGYNLGGPVQLDTSVPLAFDLTALPLRGCA